ncbi:MAG: GAF domain-containing protein [Polyangiaceae bacterium]
MRWFVEISPLGASEGQKQKWCLEAAGWQPALKDARAIRGEEGPLGGFSIELLDDGARAVDPVTRIRYVIRNAPDDAALTHTKDASGKHAPVKSDLAKVEPTKTDLAKSEPAQTDLAKVTPAPKDLAKVEPTKTDLAKSEPAKTDLAKVEPTKSDLVKVAAPEEPAGEDVDIPVDDDVSAAHPLPDYEILQEREENPNERTPLTYREYVYAVAEGTPDREIERLIHARFAIVKEALRDVTNGRFVNLAVFDHVFSGKPQRRPRATLTWKDWRGEPEIRFPAGDRSTLDPASFAAPTSFSKAVPPPSTAANAPMSAVPSTAMAPEPMSSVPSTAVAPTEPALRPIASQPPPASEPPASAPKAERMPEGPEAQRTPEPPVLMTVPPVAERAPAIAAVPSGPVTEVESTAPAPRMSAAPATVPVASGAPVMSAAPVVSAAPMTPAATTEPSPTAEPRALKIEAPVQVKIETAQAWSPVSAAPKTMPAAAPVPVKREAYIPPVKTAAQAGKRKAGDDLISELFEACGDLHFLRDSLEGADFVLSLALEKLPSEIGLVSLFDINRREFVVIRQAGGPKSVVLARLPERAGLAQAAMRKTSAIVVPDASKEPRAVDDRFRALGVQLRSLMVAPVEVSGRYLGLIELVNPVDGKPFTEGDGHALTYIGEQYAEFVAERGVVLDPESVIERHQKR